MIATIVKHQYIKHLEAKAVCNLYLEDAVDDLRRRFGKSAILPASIMGELKIPGRGIPEITMPGMMYM